MRKIVLVAAMLAAAASPAFAYDINSTYPSYNVPTVSRAYPGAVDGPQYHVQPIQPVQPPYNPYVQPNGQQNTIDRFRPGVTGIWPGDPRW
jgi:hypothetical protein